MINSKVFFVIVITAAMLVMVSLWTLSGGNAGESVAAFAPDPLPPADSLSPPISPSTTDSEDEANAYQDHLPFMIRWSNWRPEFGHAIVYAREADLQGMLNLNGSVEKMVMVASYDELSRLMREADTLKASGVTTVGFNTENGLTPANEMQTLNSANPEVNIVARAAKLASSQGFSIVWGPIRVTVDEISDQAVLAMMESGMNGLAIQEQKFIESQPAGARLTAVERTRSRYLSLADRAGIDEFSFHVQIMEQRCPDLDNCVQFVAGLEAIPVDSIAIWSMGPIGMDFVNAIRGQTANSHNAFPAS
jgi:hypothetical protein